MSRINLIARIFLSSSLALVLPIHTAQADGDPEICSPIKSLQKSCPKFAIVELPDAGKPTTITRNEGFVLYHECSAAPGGLKCGGWPQEQGSSGNLSYQWSFESAGKTLSIAPDTSATQFFGCNDGDTVTATLTVANGRYRATSSETWTCGKQDR